MLQVLVDYCVPANLLLLMLIAGTEITAADFRALRQKPGPVLIGAVGQLLFLPLIALCVIFSLPLNPAVAAGVILLSLCPGGGISNYYCYLGRCNVLLSAMIAAAGTLLALVSIPLWLNVLPALPGIDQQLTAVPVTPIVRQLIAFMIVPLAAGFLLRRYLPGFLDSHGAKLRSLSALLVFLILVAAVWTVRDKLAGLAWDIVVASALFIVLAMLLGAALSYRMGARDWPVVVIESGVRNIGVALILGGAILSPPAFGVFASFLTGYFAVEIAIMLAYARWISTRLPRLAS